MISISFTIQCLRDDVEYKKQLIRKLMPELRKVKEVEDIELIDAADEIGAIIRFESNIFLSKWLLSPDRAGWNAIRAFVSPLSAIRIYIDKPCERPSSILLTHNHVDGKISRFDSWQTLIIAEEIMAEGFVQSDHFLSTEDNKQHTVLLSFNDKRTSGSI